MKNFTCQDLEKNWDNFEKQRINRIDKTRDEIKQLEKEIEVLSAKISNDILNGKSHKELVQQFIIMDEKKTILIHMQNDLIAALTTL